MNKYSIYYVITILLNALYFVVQSHLVLIFVYAFQTLATLTIYERFNTALTGKRTTKIVLWILSIFAQFAGIYYVAIAYFENPIYSIIVAFCFSTEIWILALIKYLRNHPGKQL